MLAEPATANTAVNQRPTSRRRSCRDIKIASSTRSEAQSVLDETTLMVKVSNPSFQPHKCKTMQNGSLPTSNHLTLRQILIHYLDWPETVSSALVPAIFLHGFADTARSWEQVVRPLTQAGRRVIAPDLRGFGRSGWVGAGGYYHFPDYVADVDALVRALGLERYVLVGHSMGGAVATLLAGSRPECVAGLALLEGLGPPDHGVDHAPERFRQWLEDLREDGRSRQRTLTRAEALQRLERQHAGVPRETLERQLDHLLIEESPGQFRWHLDPLHRTTSPTPFLAASYRVFAARVRCPVLLLDGGEGGFHPPDEAERVTAFPRPVVRSVPDAGHMMHWTRPDSVADELLRFLSAEGL
jgi:pimeloyl-ACP methyl ester carboxylesterase